MLDPSRLYSALVGIKGPSVGSQLLVPGSEPACVGTVQVYQPGPCQRPGGACCTLQACTPARLHAVTLARSDPDFATESCMYVCMYVGTRKKRLDSATIHGVTHTASVIEPDITQPPRQCRHVHNLETDMYTASIIEPDITQLLRQRLLLLHTRRRRLR